MKDIFLHNKCILLAEDNPVNQVIVKHILEKKGVNVTIAQNGLEAIEKVKQKKFDLILMDVEMPLLDGYETTDALRNELGIKTPIIALTAHSISDGSQKFLDSGMNGFISKPFTLDNFCSSIENFLI